MECIQTFTNCGPHEKQAQLIADSHNMPACIDVMQGKQSACGSMVHRIAAQEYIVISIERERERVKEGEEIRSDLSEKSVNGSLTLCCCNLCVPVSSQKQLEIASPSLLLRYLIDGGSTRRTLRKESSVKKTR